MNAFNGPGIRTRAGTNRRSTKLGAVLSIGALTLSGLVAAVGPANAQLSRVGTVDDSTGFPSFYTDTNGVSLQLCLDGPPACLNEAPGPISGPDGEAFYFAADASAGGVDAHLAIEAAFLDATSPVVFARSQYQAAAGVLRPGENYTITDPYGQTTCEGNAAGGRTRCRVETGGGVTGDYTNGILDGRVGPFLVPTTSPGAGFLGNNASFTTVTGSPTNFNGFRVQGPGIQGTCAGGTIPSCAETFNFVIQGKFASPVAASTNVARLDFGSRRAAAAAAARTMQVSYKSIGSENAVVSSVTTTGPFTAVHNCATLAPGSRCSIGVTFKPIPGQKSKGSLRINDNAGGRTLALTGAGIETTRPTVRSRSPQPGATGVRLVKSVPVQFSEAVRGVNRTSFTLTNRSTGRKVRASVSRVGTTNRWVLNPRFNLTPRTRYTARLVGGPSRIRDLAGNTLRSTGWTFRAR